MNNVRPEPHPLLADAPWLRSAATRRVFDVLEARGFGVRAVGGTIRNTLLAIPVSDVDLATTAAPEQVMEAAVAAGLKAIPTGVEHGTVTIVANGVPYEVTTLRRDVATDGRRATVAFTDDWAEDARRRDFTINALYADRDGVLYDPVGGLADIVARRVRFIGDARQRIREDYLRILRFFRFSAQFAGGSLDAQGLAATIEERDGLARLSAERIRSELLRLIAAPAAASVVERMSELGFLDRILGGTSDAHGLRRVIEIEPLLQSVVDGGGYPDRILRFAALAVMQADDVARLQERLRLSNAEVKRLNAAQKAAAALAGGDGGTSIKQAVYRFGNEATIDGLVLLFARSSERAIDPALESAIALAAGWKAPALPISGGDIIARGVAPGPRVSAVIESFERWWIANDYPCDAERVGAKLAEIVLVTKS